MTRPLIGITAFRSQQPGELMRVKLNENYVKAVLAAGGAPLLIPVGFPLSFVEEICSRLDGLLFSGGGDIDPSLFHGKPHPRVGEIDKERDDLEIELLKFAVNKSIPFLGVCRGLQVMNVALGGTLFTHVHDQLPSSLRHDFFPDHPRDYLAHPVKLDTHSHLAGILGNQITNVNSLHHQGVESLATGLRASAWAPDGLIEGLEIPGHPFGISVQWHPECLPDMPGQQEIFRAFVRAAAN